MKEINLILETQNIMLSELHKLQKKRKKCDYKSWKYFFYSVHS